MMKNLGSLLLLFAFALAAKGGGKTHTESQTLGTKAKSRNTIITHDVGCKLWFK